MSISYLEFAACHSWYAPRGRGFAYTAWKKKVLHEYLAYMLQEGHTITYYPQKEYWGINLKEE